MEKNPQSHKPTYTDVFAMIDRDEYKRQIFMAEWDLPEATDENDRRLDSEPLEKLDEELGFGGEEESSIYTGLAFKLDKDGRPILNSPKMFVDKELTFCGTDYHDIDEKWRILFEFRDDSLKKTPTYVAAFDAMVRLAITEQTSEKYNISEILSQHVALSKILTCDEGFYSTPARSQMEILKSVAISCNNKLLQTIDPEDVSVESPIFYVHPDNAEEEQFTITCVDQAHENFEDRTAVTGDMIGVIYVEACVNPSKSFTSADDFFAGGVPCIVIRNDKNGTTSYIPIDKIESVEKNN